MSKYIIEIKDSNEDEIYVNGSRWLYIYTTINWPDDVNRAVTGLSTGAYIPIVQGIAEALANTLRKQGHDVEANLHEK